MHKPGGLCKRLYRGIASLLQEGHQVHYISVSQFKIEHENLIHHRLFYPFKKTDGLLFWFYFIVCSPFICLWVTYKFKIKRTFAFAPLYGCILQPCRIFMNTSLIVFLRADSIKNHEFKNNPKLVIAAERALEGIGIWKSKLVSVSKHTLNSVTSRHSYFEASEEIVLYNDIEFLFRDRKPIDLNHINLACVGILEPRKNHIFVIKALKQAKLNNIFFNIFGDGSSASEIMDYVESEAMQKQIIIHGWVDMKSYWDSIDVLILPSLHEGVSNSLLEAASFGVPVLASDIPEHREILPPNNLFSIICIDNLVEVLNDLSSKPEKVLQKLISDQQGKLSMLRFDWDEAFVNMIID